MPAKVDRKRWTTETDLRLQVLKLWESGQLLASLLGGAPLFPKRLFLTRPTSSDVADRFDEVRTWVSQLRSIPHLRIEMRRVNHRLFGENELPDQVWIESPDHALALVGRGSDAAHFLHLAAITRDRRPELMPWLAKKPHCALGLLHEWETLLEVVAWVRNHPKPGVYFRQVNIPGVHTKLIESYRGVLSELLDIVLPSEAIDTHASGASEFARRYGFLEKPLRVRFRVLDPQCILLDGCAVEDVTLDAGSFAGLKPKVSQVFITENETNFLGFPKIRKSLVLFGAGYGFEMLRDAQWLRGCRVYYWGDIDTHGFAILDQLRGVLPDVHSFLMDRTTLMKFAEHWQQEERQVTRDLPKLNADERALYNELRHNSIREKLRLEQERIGFNHVEACLHNLLPAAHDQ